jgi:uncharacterized protein
LEEQITIGTSGAVPHERNRRGRRRLGIGNAATQDAFGIPPKTCRKKSTRRPTARVGRHASKKFLHRLWLALATFVAMLFFVAPVLALEPPKLIGRVNDYADILSETDEARIGRMLESHEKATGQQFAVLTIPSLEGDSPERFSIETVEAWKLGRAKEDDGLLLLVVRDDHKVRIEVGRGLEGSITDAVSSRIIRGILVPAFKRDDYPGGIQRALGALTALETKGVANIPEEPPPERQQDHRLPAPIAMLVLLAMLFVPFWIARRGGRGPGGFGGGWYGGYGGFGGGGFSGGGGGWSGGSSGGGGFSGGGGSFGGGGASGSW